MTKTFFFAIAAFASFTSLAQQKQTKAPPPPPKVDVEKVAPPPPPKAPAHPKPVVTNGADYKEFLKRNPTVKRVAWGVKNTMTVYLKSGAIERYNLNEEKDLATLENKYGELPAAPPPPPEPKPKKFDPPVIIPD